MNKDLSSLRRLGGIRVFAAHLALTAGLLGGSIAMTGQGSAIAAECERPFVGPEYFTNSAAGGGCVTVSHPAGSPTYTVVSVVPSAGWTAQVKTASGSKVEVRFTELATGRRVDFKMSSNGIVIR